MHLLLYRFDFVLPQLITNTGKCSEIECSIVCVSSDDLDALCQWLQEKDIAATTLI